MPSPYRALPPLNTLRTFEAVVRNQGFTRAGAELGLTQSAISRQIAQLEQDLGARLLIRDRAGVALTLEGRTLLDGARAGLDTVLLAAERIRARRRVGVLAIGAPASFAAWWLAPRLGRFAMRAPEIEVRLAAVDDDPDLERLGLDAAVVLRPSARPARDDEVWLLSEKVAPVCSPAFIHRQRLETPADLSACRLIECEGAEEQPPEFGWRHWLSRLGIPEPAAGWFRFGDAGLAITAAIDGLGVALGRSPMIDAELAAGRLIKPFPERFSATPRQVYALKWRRPSSQNLQVFRDFVLDEACGCELAAGPCGLPPSDQDIRDAAELRGDRAALRTLSISA
jgi:LysR family glycine cleavage system transcriptional activator